MMREIRYWMTTVMVFLPGLAACGPVRGDHSLIGQGCRHRSEDARALEPVALILEQGEQQISFPRLILLHDDRVYVSMGYVESGRSGSEAIVHRWCWVPRAETRGHEASMDTSGVFFDLISRQLFRLEYHPGSAVAVLTVVGASVCESATYTECDPRESPMCPSDSDGTTVVIDGSLACRDVIAFNPPLVL